MKSDIKERQVRGLIQQLIKVIRRNWYDNAYQLLRDEREKWELEIREQIQRETDAWRDYETRFREKADAYIVTKDGFRFLSEIELIGDYPNKRPHVCFQRTCNRDRNIKCLDVDFDVTEFDCRDLRTYELQFTRAKDGRYVYHEI